MTPDGVLRALERAVTHADRGRPEAATAFPKRLQQYEMTARRSRKGQGSDHAMIESWHRLRKKALLDLTTCRTRAEAAVAICAAIEIFIIGSASIVP
jgi:putative transposase